MESRVNTARDLGLCVDFISDLSHFIFAPILVCPVPMLFLTFLYYIRFVFSRCISLWIVD